ncbi:MAG TPA: YtxH domain-containing protein [Gemmatimonadales bacterium]
MSEREGGGTGSFGAFLVGLAVGAAVGFLFAPEAGTSTRRKVSRKFEDLKMLAAEKAGELGELVAAAREDRAAVSGAKKELQRRVLEARRRRHAVRAARREGSTVAAEGEEDEPVA